MVTIKEKVTYKAFGLTIHSEITLPELTQVNNYFGSADVEIKVRDHSVSYSYIKPNEFIVKDDIVMFELPNVALFRICEGREIIVTPKPNAHNDEIRLYILGTCMGAILMQRGIFPLHGSAVVVNGKAYAFVGDSGAGKSTLGLAFINSGYQLLTDDVIAVTLSKDNIPIITPSYPQQKLWEESLIKFGMNSTNFRPIIQRETKFTVPVDSKYTEDSYPMAGIFELIKVEDGDVEICEIKGIEQLRTLFFHTYRNFLIPQLGKMDWHFDFSAKIANKIKMFRLKRPNTSYTVNRLVENILQSIEQ